MVFDWLKSKTRRETLSFIGAGVGAVALAFWTIFTYEPAKKDANKDSMVSNNNLNPTITVSPVINPNISINTPPQLSGVIETTYTVCQGGGDIKDMCPPGAIMLPCGSPRIEEWAASKCSKFIASAREAHPGGMCGLEKQIIKCTAFIR